MSKLFRPCLIILIAVALILTLAGCSSPSSNNNRTSIVVTYSILGSIVKSLVGDQATITVLIPNGLDLHEWEPSAKDIEKAYNAILLVGNGLELESGLAKTIENAEQKGVHVFFASDHIEVRHVKEGEGIPSNDPDQAIGAPDPHLWTDPLTIKQMIPALAEDIKAYMNLDVSARAAALSTDLEALNSEITSLLSVVSQDQRKMVTGHESMGYFAQRYNFRLVGVIVPSLSSAADVTAADLANLKKVIQQTGVKAIFTETGTSPATAKAIADETGVKAVELNTHALPADGTYHSYMQQLAGTVAGALK
jgi:zinc/manganese transport system substrate-binding protein